MNHRPAPLRDRLRAIDAARAERQTGLIAALNGQSADSETLTVRTAFERDRRAAAAWIRFRAGDAPVLLAPLLVDGALARLSQGPGGSDPAAAAALLARIEPLVAAIEQALATELFPKGLDREAAADSILLRIDASAAGSIRHRLIAAFAPAGPLAAPLKPRPIPAPLGMLRVRWRARLAGPPLRATRLATIGAGDMLLLGLRPLLAQITIPGRIGRLSGRIDLIRGAMTLQNETDHPPNSGEAAAAPESSGGERAGGGATAQDEGGRGVASQASVQAIDWGAVKVATVIEIDGGMVSASDVAALGGGSVLPLPSAGAGTLPVRVVAGGTVIGAGELVAVGDGFGVLFTSVATGGDRLGDPADGAAD